MSSPCSSRSPTATSMDQEEPRKKGARGGKRSVTHLSKAQLARKRANDREAQRNIRQRTKEHIENLERKVKELEGGSRAASMERVLARNRELEDEIDKLRAQIRVQTTPSGPNAPIAQDISEELLMPQKTELEWVPAANSTWSQSSLPPHIRGLQAEAPISAPYTNEAQIYSTASEMGTNRFRGEEAEAAQHLYSPAPVAIPIWDDPMVFGPQENTSQSQQSLTKTAPAWTPFHPAFSQPSRFADLQQSGLADVINNSSFGSTNCWQSQPSIYAWQISTKLKSPITQIDHLMFSVVNSQRHLAITSDLSGEDLIGPDFPSVHMFFDQPGPAKPPTSLTEVMARYAQVLSNRGFALIPEKLASFMCMYRFVQWQISPTHSTYQQLHDWQAPRPSQLLIAHPAWMDLPPWGDFREKVIQNQDRYDNIEFQNDYASNLSVNFPDPMKALIFEDGQIKVSKALDRHLSDINNMSLKRPFAMKYPEFRDVCRFDEVFDE